MVKNLPAMRETRVPFLGWEDPLEKGTAPVFLPGDSRDRGAWWATVHGVTKSQTRLVTDQRAYYSLLKTAIKTGWHQ